MTRRTVAGLLSLIVLSTSVARADKMSRNEKHTTITVTYGVVIDVNEVDVKSDAGKGALVGGALGLALGHGKSTKNQVAAGAAGAAVGAGVTAAAEGKHKAHGYTVKRTDGETIKVIMDEADAIVGDCVAIETGKTTNLRRVAATLCDTPSTQADPKVPEAHDADAEACQKAKEALLAAETPQAVELATNKVKVLCH